MSNFRVGQQVILIQDIDCCGFVFDKDLIVTVASVRMSRTTWGELRPAFIPVEVDLRGAAFDQAWFRPLVTRKTDISVFTRILDRANGRERVS